MLNPIPTPNLSRHLVKDNVASTFRDGTLLLALAHGPPYLDHQEPDQIVGEEVAPKTLNLKPLTLNPVPFSGDH